MLKVSAFIAMSIDGYIAGPNHELDWLTSMETEGEDYGYGDFIKDVSIVIMGRNTFNKVLSFGGEFPFADQECYVITSRHLPSLMPKRVTAFNGSPSELVMDLTRKNKSGTVYADGGMVISNLLEHGQLNRLTVSIVPVILGNGIPLFNTPMATRKLKLESNRSYPSGLVQLDYTIMPE